MQLTEIDKRAMLDLAEGKEVDRATIRRLCAVLTVAARGGTVREQIFYFLKDAGGGPIERKELIDGLWPGVRTEQRKSRRAHLTKTVKLYPNLFCFANDNGVFRVWLAEGATLDDQPPPAKNRLWVGPAWLVNANSYYCHLCEKDIFPGEYAVKVYKRKGAMQDGTGKIAHLECSKAKLSTKP